MDVSRIVNRKMVILIVVGSIVLVGTWLVANTVIFHLKRSDPPFNAIPTSVVSIKLTYSQPIASVGSVTLNNSRVSGVKINGNSLEIPFKGQGFSKDDSPVLEIKSLKSRWFNAVIETKAYTLRVVYVDFNKLSNDQKRAQIDASYSDQVDDPFLNGTFPIITDHYRITPATTGDGKTIVINVTFYREVPDYDNGGKITQLPNSVAEGYRKQVYETIRQRGGTPEKYIFYYSNSYLNSKYGDHSHN